MRYLLFFLFSFFTLLARATASEWDESAQQKNPCNVREAQAMRLRARHIEGKGIGYGQGYTTLEGFFSPLKPWKEVWRPFIDVRGHFFNNQKWAGNAGLGARYQGDKRIYGFNGYYDYRKSRRSYHQMALGLESLGKIWDFRLNGYLPIGGKKSSYFHTRFSSFKDHFLFISRKREYAMKGFNGEVGAHVNRIRNIPLYFTLGPYYLRGQGKAAWGGQARARLSLFDCVSMEGKVSYDPLFKWIGQGEIGLTFSLGRIPLLLLV
jgi:hypothetical protein